MSAALESLAETLAANIVLLSSWDKYKKEVLSGRGRPAARPRAGGGGPARGGGGGAGGAAAQVLRVLLKLLEASRDSKTLAVGASDLGHFISAHPHGRAIVTGMRSTPAWPVTVVLMPCRGMIGECVGTSPSGACCLPWDGRRIEASNAPSMLPQTCAARSW